MRSTIYQEQSLADVLGDPVYVNKALKYGFPIPKKPLFLPIVARNFSYTMDVMYILGYQMQDDDIIPGSNAKTKSYYYRTYRKESDPKPRIANERKGEELMEEAEEHNIHNDIIGCLVFIETTSRKLWSYPLQTNKATDVFEAFLMFLRDINYNIVSLLSDSGLEYELIKQFNLKNHLFDYKQVNVSQGSHLPLSRIDRVIRTLRTLVNHYFRSYGRENWAVAMPLIVYAYNTTPHTSLVLIHPKTKEKFYYTPEQVFTNPILMKRIRVKDFLLKKDNYRQLNKFKTDGETPYHYRVVNSTKKEFRNGFVSLNTITLKGRKGNSFLGSDGVYHNFRDLVAAKNLHREKLSPVKQRLENILRRNANNYFTEFTNEDNNYEISDLHKYLRNKKFDKKTPNQIKFEQITSLYNYIKDNIGKEMPLNIEYRIRKEILDSYDYKEGITYNRTMQEILGEFHAYITKIEEDRNEKVRNLEYTEDDKYKDERIYQSLYFPYFTSDETLNPLARSMKNSLLIRIKGNSFKKDDDSRYLGYDFGRGNKDKYNIHGYKPILGEEARKLHNRKQYYLKKGTKPKPKQILTKKDIYHLDKESNDLYKVNHRAIADEKDISYVGRYGLRKRKPLNNN